MVASGQSESKGKKRAVAENQSSELRYRYQKLRK
jgi:hypothetical protein